MKLNRTGSVWDRDERNNINENWDSIEGYINDNQNLIDSGYDNASVINMLKNGNYQVSVNFATCYQDVNTGVISGHISTMRVFLESGTTPIGFSNFDFTLNANEVLYIDFSEIEPKLKIGTTSIASGVVYGVGGFYKDEKLLLLSPLYNTFIGHLADSFKLALERTKNEKMFAHKPDADTYHIYIQSKRNPRKYARYDLKNVVIPHDPSNRFSNVNVTEHNGVYLIERNLDGTFTSKGRITDGGAWSCAIRESGTSDGIGGIAHGDEIDQYLNIRIDGTRRSMSSKLMSYDEIEFISMSYLYRESQTYTNLEKIGTHFKSFKFTKDGLIMDSKVIIEKEMTFLYFYLGMCSVLKTYTDKAISDIDTSIQNLLVESPIHNKRPGINRIDVYGDNVYVKTEVLDQVSPSIPSAKVEHVSYNKIYYDLVEQGYTVAPNTPFRQKTLIEIAIL